MSSSVIAASLEICLCSVPPCQLSRGAPPQILGQPLDSAKYQLLFDSFQYSLQLYPLGLMEINWQLQFGWFLRLTIPSLWVSWDNWETLPWVKLWNSNSFGGLSFLASTSTISSLSSFCLCDAIIWGFENYLCSAIEVHTNQKRVTGPPLMFPLAPGCL